MPDSKPHAETSPLVQFAKDLGCKKGLDPIPPDQYLTYQDARYSPALRLWAWLLAHTIRQKHRKPYAVDAHGKEMTLQNAATDLQMDDGNVRRAWRELEIEKRVRKEGPRLYAAGDFQLPKTVEDGEQKGNKKVCTDLFPQYILKQLKKLPLETRKTIEVEYAREIQAEQRCASESMAAVRSIFNPRKDSILTRHGVKIIRTINSEQPELFPTEAGDKDLRLIFATALEPILPRFVQTSEEPSEERSVQTRKGGLYKTENDGVQRIPPDASLYTESREVQRTTTTGPTATDADVVVVCQRLGIKAKAAQTFLTNCRRESPECSLEEVAAVIDQVEATINRKKVRNPTAVILENVPLNLTGYRQSQKPIANNYPPCWICGYALDDTGAINGAHFACFEEAQAKKVS